MPLPSGLPPLPNLPNLPNLNIPLPDLSAVSLTGISGLPPTTAGTHAQMWSHDQQSGTAMLLTVSIRHILITNYFSFCRFTTSPSSESAWHLLSAHAHRSVLNAAQHARGHAAIHPGPL